MDSAIKKIIDGCIHNLRPAQAQLYNIYCNRMMSVCMWYAKDKQQAEEILQDSFMCVFRNIHTYRGDGPLEQWIRKIVINTALQALRKDKGYKNTFAPGDYLPDDVIEKADFIYHFDEKVILKLIQSLSPTYRLVFNLFVIEGLKHKQIAECLGITEGTSKSNLADARAILQKKIIRLKKRPAYNLFGR